MRKVADRNGKASRPLYHVYGSMWRLARSRDVHVSAPQYQACCVLSVGPSCYLYVGGGCFTLFERYGTTCERVRMLAVSVRGGAKMLAPRRLATLVVPTHTCGHCHRHALEAL